MRVRTHNGKICRTLLGHAQNVRGVLQECLFDGGFGSRHTGGRLDRDEI